MSELTPKRAANLALTATALLYGAFVVGNAIVPGFVGWSLLLIGGFFYLPARMLEGQRKAPEYKEVGPEVRLPPWSWKAARTAALVSLVVFPLFAAGMFVFYGSICPDLSATWIHPLFWLEEVLGFRASGEVSPLGSFLTAVCHGHSGGYIPESFEWPKTWTEYRGAGFVAQVSVAVLVAALPEEMFHRAYLMSALERRWPPKFRVFGVPFGFAAVLSSAIFAIGHLVGEARIDRLATFFPSLLFSWVWRRTGKVWAPVLVHAAANVFMELLVANI